MIYYIQKWIEKKYFEIPGNLAIYDQLTSIYNYNWYDKIGKAKWAQQDCYITLMDLNNFKHINDTKGHEYANEILISVASQLKRIREVDADADVFRYGGDEFVMFSTVCLSDKIDKENKDMLSFGCYHKNKYESITISLEKADELMYKNKKARKEKLRKEENRYNLDAEQIDISSWETLYQALYKYLYTPGTNVPDITNFYNFKNLMMSITDVSYGYQISLMEPIFVSSYIPDKPYRTLHRIRSAISNELIDLRFKH